MEIVLNDQSKGLPEPTSNPADYAATVSSPGPVDVI